MPCSERSDEAVNPAATWRRDLTSEVISLRGGKLALFTLPLMGGGQQNRPAFATAVCVAPRGHRRTAKKLGLDAAFARTAIENKKLFLCPASKR